MYTGKSWEEQELKEIIKYVDDGYSLEGVAKKLGRSSPAVSTRLVQEGVSYSTIRKLLRDKVSRDDILKKMKSNLPVVSDDQDRLEHKKSFDKLPCWITDRMMSDMWYFGLLTDAGMIIGISHINKISEDGKWIEVEFLNNTESFLDTGWKGKTFSAVCDREYGCIQVSKIVAAFELTHT